MPKLPTRYQAATAEICALGDEAHYEQRSRHVGLCPPALEIIEQFDTVKERSALAIAFMDSYDIAQQRQITFDILGIPMELRA